ncbi:DUF2059 domain-containing protein [Anaeromyxobacter sp. Fw109-5]|uniref:DUF2059 domain-containing protein n=1 Tax=Anaeromyxobacter sp. (strain Fw109-5) TaxID=404589 RepID=UPI0000ED79E0|nr:DUF2059 domain-containing protein [Anaeromyxobacter sp. Fw109-5]ABS24443.1 conserved hypothetical protein [Anaeromyxobacter sp. Fw109-5]
MPRLALVAALLLSLAPSARAGTPAPAGRAAAAVELARFALPRATWDQTLAAVLGQIEQQAASGGSALPAGFSEALREELGQLFSYEEILDLQAGLLAKHYTEAEMQQLVAFYRTPLGQKTIRIMPEVAADAMGQVQVLMGQRVPAMMERLQRRFGPEAAKAKAGAK